jgi:hypothetical protein
MTKTVKNGTAFLMNFIKHMTDTAIQRGNGFSIKATAAARKVNGGFVMRIVWIVNSIFHQPTH